MANFSKTQPLPTLSDIFATELSAVVFGQHVHLILILVIFSSGVVRRRTDFTTVTPNGRRTKRKHSETSELLQRVNENLFHHRCEECLRVEGQHFQHLL
jgi:hypothetical protein